MTALLYPVVGLALLGLVASAIVHLTTLLGMAPLRYAWVLHVGVFVVWLPAVVIAYKQTAEFRQKDFWKAALRGCPPWASRGLNVLFGYAMLNFVLFSLSEGKGEGDKAIAEFRGFSGHWMAFYGAAAAILYSATKAEALDRTRRCLQGHPVSPVARFCDQCGSPVST